MSNILSVIDVIRALTIIIEDAYPNYQVIDMDIEEDFPRPCYFIDVDNVSTEWQASEYLKESSNLKIVFFAENRYDGFLDLLDMKNALTKLFNNPIKVDNGEQKQVISLLETTSELYKADKVLEFSITVDLIQRVPKDEDCEYIMDTLETKGV